MLYIFILNLRVLGKEELDKLEKLKNEQSKMEEKIKEQQRRKLDLQKEIEQNKRKNLEKLEIRNRQKNEIKELSKIKLKYLLSTNDKKAMELISNRNNNDDDREYPEQIEMDQNCENNENEQELEEENQNQYRNEWEDDDHDTLELDENVVDEDVDVSDIDTIGPNGYGTESTQVSAIDIHRSSFHHTENDRGDNLTQRNSVPPLSQRSRSMIQSPRNQRPRTSLTPDPMPRWMRNDRNDSFVNDFNL